MAICDRTSGSCCHHHQVLVSIEGEIGMCGSHNLGALSSAVGEASMEEGKVVHLELAR